MQIIEFLLSAVVLVAVYYAAHSLWRREAMVHAATWANAQGLVLRKSTATKFRMHRTSPSIVVMVSDAAGHEHECTLWLVRKPVLSAPLWHNWLRAEYRNHVHFEANGA